VRTTCPAGGGLAAEVGMVWLGVIVLVVAVPVGLLVWLRSTRGQGDAGGL